MAVAKEKAENYPQNHELRVKYRAGGVRHGPLPHLPGLRTFEARECLKCDFLSESVKSLGFHMKVSHYQLKPQ